MDLRLPGLNGVEATRRILAAQPEVGIVILTAADAEAAEVLAAVEAGVVGYLAKTADQEELLEAIRRVASGEAWLPVPHTPAADLAQAASGHGDPDQPGAGRAGAAGPGVEQPRDRP